MHEVREKDSLDTLGPHTRVFLLTGLPCTFTFQPVTGATADPTPTSSSRFTEWTRTKMLRERETTAQGHSAHRPDCEPAPAPSRFVSYRRPSLCTQAKWESQNCPGSLVICSRSRLRLCHCL